MTIPRFDALGLSPESVRDALSNTGCFQISHPLLPLMLSENLLAEVRSFFELPAEIKTSIGIERSRHFRGYSEMRNERDWREQIHFGLELPAAGVEPAYLQLQGPNLWHPDQAWKQRVMKYLGCIQTIAAEVLSVIAKSLELPADYFVSAMCAPYLLMKFICYRPQPIAGVFRPGVAAHVDFSWITLTLQDETGGLGVRRSDGVWVDVPPVPGTLLVHTGELLDFATRGLYFATPHRVVNRSSQRTRLSIPVFVNPNLRATVRRLPRQDRLSQSAVGEHVHRVLRTDDPYDAFVFGEAEWKRKGLNVWCTDCVRK
jgi:isopenicillin N synthase-like dioxygenase